MRSHIGWTLALGAACVLAAPLQIAFAQDQNLPCYVSGEKTHPLIRTHTRAPYPVESVRQGEQGAVLLDVYIGMDGSPANVAVEKSSGFAGLDETSRTWVQRNWRWQPRMENPGNCAIIVTRVNYIWNMSLSGMVLPPNAKPYNGQDITKFLLDHP